MKISWCLFGFLFFNLIVYSQVGYNYYIIDNPSLKYADVFVGIRIKPSDMSYRFLGSYSRTGNFKAEGNLKRSQDKQYLFVNNINPTSLDLKTVIVESKDSMSNIWTNFIYEPAFDSSTHFRYTCVKDLFINDSLVKVITSNKDSLHLISPIRKIQIGIMESTLLSEIFVPTFTFSNINITFVFKNSFFETQFFNDKTDYLEIDNSRKIILNLESRKYKMTKVSKEIFYKKAWSINENW